MKQGLRKLTFGCSLALIAICTAGTAGAQATASVVLDTSHQMGGTIPNRFVGISFEWTLVEWYTNPNARPAFSNLLRNLNTGMIRVGGGSQDTQPFVANAPLSTFLDVSNASFASLRATMDVINVGAPAASTPPWGIVLGSAMTPSANPATTQSFVQGVAAAFVGDERLVSISLGNEPDQDGYGTTFNSRWLTDFATYSNPAVTGSWPLVVPSTSTDIVPWQTLANQAQPSRWFWSWPQILDNVAATVNARAGVFGPWVSDHYYPLARTCVGQPYRCPSISVLLGPNHIQDLDYLVYTHATEAVAHGVPYRLEETNTAAHQGAPGVSDVAASTTYALDMMFHVACPQPPDQPGVNANCGIGGIGVNLHNAARMGNTDPQDGNAYYNPIDFDSSTAMGAPSAAPEYYALLFFSHFAQGTSGLRPVTVAGQDAASISAWRVEAGASERRLFLINKSAAPVTTNVSNAASGSLVSWMTPFDPTGAGLALDATAMLVDGRQVAADGTWPGFAPTTVSPAGGVITLTLAPGEAVVVRSGVPTDVSSSMRIKAAPYGGDPQTLFVAIDNVSSTAIDGPLYLVVDGLASGVTLANASGIVANAPPVGAPYITVLGADQSIGVGVSKATLLRFSTTGAAISYSARVLAGPGAP